MGGIQKTKGFKIATVIFTVMVLVTSVPSGVYAGKQVGSTGVESGKLMGANTGVDTQFTTGSDGLSTLRQDRFGSFRNEGVRCYIYDKSSDSILESESELYQGKKAIDFLGYRYSGDTTVYDYVQSIQGKIKEIDTTTAFGNIENADEIESSSDYPFEFNGIQYYYEHYIYNGVAELTGKDVFNKIVSGADDVNTELKENRGQELSNIIAKYWGISVVNEFRRNGNLMFITEPIFITSAMDTDQEIIEQDITDGEETPYSAEEQEEMGIYMLDGNNSNGESYTEHYTEEITRTAYFELYDGDTCNAGNEDRIKAVTYMNPDGTFTTDRDIYNLEIEDISTMDARDMFKLSDEDDPDINVNHVEKYTWTVSGAEHTVYYYKHFKYVYGTAREIYEQYRSGLQIAHNYTIADSVCDAVYCKEIGENGEYNAEYPLIFPDDTKAQKPTYGGAENVLEVNGTKTTWGMSILASKEFNESIWHTNKYTTGEPSGVPADDVTNYPNDNGHPYGNNV